MKKTTYRGRPIEIMIEGNIFHVYDHLHKQPFPLRPVMDHLKKKFGNRPIKPRVTAISYAQKAAADALEAFRKTRIEFEDESGGTVEKLLLANFDYNASSHHYICTLDRRE